MPTPTDFHLFCLVILLAAGVLTITVCLLDRWLVKVFDPDALPPPLRVRKIRKKYEPPVPARYTVYPNGKEVTGND